MKPLLLLGYGLPIALFCRPRRRHGGAEMNGAKKAAKRLAPPNHPALRAAGRRNLLLTLIGGRQRDRGIPVVQSTPRLVPRTRADTQERSCRFSCRQQIRQLAIFPLGASHVTSGHASSTMPSGNWPARLVRWR